MQSSLSNGEEKVIALSSLAPYEAKDTLVVPEREWSYLEREIDYIMNIWPGEYDNVEQLDYHKYGHPQSDIQPKRIHATIKKVDLPSFGDNVLVVHEYVDNNPENVMHQALYSLQPNEEDFTIDIEVFEFVKKQHLDDLESDLARTKYTPTTSAFASSWIIQMTRQGQYFHGKSMNTSERNSCEVQLEKGKYFLSRHIYESGNIQHQLEQARCFVCMIDFPREDGGRPVKTEHYIEIQDQGGSFEFDYRDGRHMVLGMRNTWSYGMQRETFVIFIQEGSDKGPTLIYSWGEPGADRIGFNPGWIRVQCDLDTPENRAFQQNLRSDS